MKPTARLLSASARVGASVQSAARPTALVVICVDGCDIEYLHAARKRGVMPFMSRIMSKPGKQYFEIQGAMPSFTNPNNTGILTGGPPSWHGICGNYRYDRESGKEVSTEHQPLAAPSLLALAREAKGCPIVVVTAKHKLLGLLTTGLPSPGLQKPGLATGLATGLSAGTGMQTAAGCQQPATGTTATAASPSVPAVSPDASDRSPSGALARASAIAKADSGYQPGQTLFDPVTGRLWVGRRPDNNGKGAAGHGGAVPSADLPPVVAVSIEGATRQPQQQPWQKPQAVGSAGPQLQPWQQHPHVNPSAAILDAIGYDGPWPGIYDPWCSIGVLEVGRLLIQRAVLEQRQKAVARQKRSREGIAARPGAADSTGAAASADSDRPGQPVVAFLSTTDFVQHKAGPYDPLAIEFMRHLDSCLKALHDDGCAIAVTADHGMNDKHHSGPERRRSAKATTAAQATAAPGSSAPAAPAPAPGSPNVVWLGQTLADANIPARVVLPITDAHVRHHGALGGYAVVHLGSHAAQGIPAPKPDTPEAYRAQVQIDELLPRAAELLRGLQGVESVLTRAEAASLLQLPADGIGGELVVLSQKHTVLGKSPAEHDLSAVSGHGPGSERLRSHGGPHDASVPLLLNWDYTGPAGAAVGSRTGQRANGRTGDAARTEGTAATDADGPLVQPGALRNWHALAALLHRFGVLDRQQLPPHLQKQP